MLLWTVMREQYDSELDRLLDQVRDLLGAGDDTLLVEANIAVNHALQLHPESIDGWLLKCQVASATGDDLAALAAVEMAIQRAPLHAESLYWRGAVLGDLGRHREALRAIEAAFSVLDDQDHWLLEDLFYEKVLMLDSLSAPRAWSRRARQVSSVAPALPCSAPHSHRPNVRAFAARSRSCAAASDRHVEMGASPHGLL